jgi:hypothetical protein
MEQSPPWEPPCMEAPCPNSPPLIPVLSQTNLAHNLLLYSYAYMIGILPTRLLLCLPDVSLRGFLLEL